MSASSDSFTTHEWLRNKNTKTLKQEWFLIEESINNIFRQLVVARSLLYRCRLRKSIRGNHVPTFSLKTAATFLPARGRNVVAAFLPRVGRNVVTRLLNC